jgi:hypothetical protein
MRTNENNSPKPFRWTDKALRVARMVAEDLLTDRRIAKEAKIATATLERWKLHPDFAARVAELVKAFGDRCANIAIAKRHRRIADYDERKRRMVALIRARANDPEHRVAVGGDTGLLVRTIKQIGGGETAEKVEEFHVDAALLKELRELEKQAAQDLGQWTEKKEVSGVGGKPIAFIEVRSSDDETADRDDDAADEGRGGAGPGV